MKQNRLETGVGIFMLIGFAAIIYLALQLGEVPFITDSKTYSLQAEFDNVAGVKKGASVQVSGVVVGSVAAVKLNEDDVALLTLKLDKTLEIPTDSIASVRSQGIIGDKYIQINLGGDDEIFQPGGIIQETESSVDIESLISKFAFGSAE